MYTSIKKYFIAKKYIAITASKVTNHRDRYNEEV